MFRTTKSVAARVYAFVNAAVVLLVLLGVFTGVNWDQMPGGIGEFLTIRITLKNLFLTALFLLAWAIAFRAFGLTRPSPAAPLWRELIQVTKACTVASVFALLFPLTSHSGAFTDRIVLYFLPVAILACLCGRLVARAFAGRLARALSGHHDLIIVGSGPRASAIYERLLREPCHGYTRILGFVDSPNGHLASAAVQRQMLGGLDDLEGVLMKQPVDEVVIALPAKSCYDQIQTAIQTCERAGVEARYLSDVFQLSLARPRFEPHETAPIVSLKVVQDDYRLVAKRCIDIVGAIVGLILFSPLMFAIVVAIKLTCPGSALFTQARCGWHKHPFSVYKFRTMVPNADQLLDSYLADNPDLSQEWRKEHKLKHDPRVTRIGRILRKTSMDELPQLLNVLKGDMSLVGPRPIVDAEVQKYGDSFAFYRQMVPGLTGLWQVSGRNNCSYQQRVDFDTYYLRNWSLLLDLCLIAKTAKVLITRIGAY